AGWARASRRTATPHAAPAEREGADVLDPPGRAVPAGRLGLAHHLGEQARVEAVAEFGTLTPYFTCTISSEREDRMAEHVSARALGDATVAAISDGVGPWAPQLQAPEAEWRREVPEADEKGEFPLEWSVGFARVGDALAVVDLGFDDPGPDSRWMPPRFQRSAGVEAGLHSLGVTNDQVTHVLLTHPHGDHIAGAFS